MYGTRIRLANEIDAPFRFSSALVGSRRFRFSFQKGAPIINRCRRTGRRQRAQATAVAKARAEPRGG